MDNQELFVVEKHSAVYFCHDSCPDPIEMKLFISFFILRVANSEKNILQYFLWY